jgi:cytochrome b6-f complex iron-sulfur subunit
MSEEEKPVSKGQPGNPDGLSRRDFFNEVAISALGIAGLGATVVTYRYLSPNVLFEPPAKFRAGSPELYPINSITFLEDQQVYIVRTAAGFYAVSAICTHLGCITRWNPQANQIQCPCHGSKFKRDGTKVVGPAPRSLDHFSISLTADGELQVDKLEIIKQSQVLKA